MNATIEAIRPAGFPAAVDLRSDERIVSHSSGLRDALHRLERVAPLDTSVLFTGETGTGKNLLARRLHRCSRRAGRPLGSGNLPSIPETLVASGLFGPEQGAFPGAPHRPLGPLELAGPAPPVLAPRGRAAP